MACLKAAIAPGSLCSGNALRGEALIWAKPAPATWSPPLGSLPPVRAEIRENSEIVRGGAKEGATGEQFGTQPLKGGTKYSASKKLKVLDVESMKIRDKLLGDAPSSLKLLSRVEQLRLLSKAEKAGLLSAAEKLGLSLTSIEKLGLLSKAEKFGALSAAVDPKTPLLLRATALGLLAIGPAFVYFVPENSTPLVVLQVIVALISVLGGSAAFAASSFVYALQSSD